MDGFWTQYGLFLAETVTVVLAIAAVIVIARRGSQRGAGAEHLEVKSLNRKYRQLERSLQRHILPKRPFSQFMKAQKARDKAERKQPPAQRRRVFVLNFHGDIRASAVASLREEVTAILTLARTDDEVVVRLDNAGGLVHEHGLAASQLLRLRARGIPLTVAVDKVAASGGYMMACVADRILAAPFAIIGSIGVLAQIPNFHRWMERHGIDFELVKAGELKRTLTMFGENSEADRAHMQEQIEDTHGLFKRFVAEHRPQLDLEAVGTGQYWLASRALELKLVDALSTSDDYLLTASEQADLFELRYAIKRPLARKLLGAAREAADALVYRRAP